MKVGDLVQKSLRHSTNSGYEDWRMPDQQFGLGVISKSIAREGILYRGHSWYEVEVYWTALQKTTTEIVSHLILVKRGK